MPSILGSNVLISVNPHAGARSARETIEGVRQALINRGLSVEVDSDRAALAEQANEEHRHGTLRALVAAGGDGTASDLVNRTRAEVPIALLPLGTENLLARYLRIPTEIEALATMIATGRKIQLDAGRANGRLFLIMAGCGFDADVVHRLHGSRDGHITQWSYAKPILDAIRNYRYPEFRVTCRLNSANDEVPICHSFPARWAFIANLPSYAGRLCFSPEAAGDDGMLDVCAFQGGSFWAGLRYLFGVLTRRHESMRDCVTIRGTHIVLEANEPVPYQLDGDPGGMLPLTIDLLPRRMTVVVPSGPLTTRHRQSVV
jgi:diacylglycerol kinase (ATP)